MHDQNGRRDDRHPNPGSRMNMSYRDDRSMAPSGNRNEPWRYGNSDERGGGRWPSGEHEGAYGAQHGGYLSGQGDGQDHPDRWNQDLGRHQDRWSHGGYNDAGRYGGSHRQASGRGDRYGRPDHPDHYDPHYSNRFPNDERMSRGYNDERTGRGHSDDRMSPGFDARMRHGFGSERMDDRFDTMNDVPSYRPSWAAQPSSSGSFGSSDSGSSRREFYGKGPKGYARSDERIREEICERLSEGYLDASDIEVTVKDGEVTLSGTTSDRRTKRLAEELADGVRGVKDIENRLKFMSGASETAKAETAKADTQKAEAQKTEAPKTETQSKSAQNGAASQRV